MADRRIVISILGNASRMIKSVSKADSSLTKFRGTALKAALGIAALNSAMTLGSAAVVLFAGLLAALPIALAGIGLAGAAMDERVQSAFGNLKKRATETLKGIGKPLVEPLVKGAESLGRAFESVAPYLTEISRAAAPLVSGFFAKVETFADKVGPKLPAMFRNAIPVLEGFASLFGQIGKAIGRFFGGDLLKGSNLKEAFTTAGATIAGFLDRVRAIADFLTPFIEQIAAGLQPVIDAVVVAFDALLKKLEPVSKWFKEHPSVIQALATAIGIVVVALYAFSVVMAIVNAVMLLNPVTWIILGIVALIAIIILCVRHWDKIKATMSKLWGWIKGVFAKGWDWLKNKLSQAVQGFVRANKKAWDTVKKALATAITWYVGLPGRILRAVGRFGSLLLSKGRDLVSGLSRGVVNRWNGLRSWIRGVPGRIKSAIGNLGGLLTAAGRALLGGLYNGIAEKWRQVQSLVGGMASWIRDNKGPISYDLRLLIDNGKALMSGLDKGLLEGFNQKVKKTIGKITDTIGAGFSAEITPEFKGDLLPAGAATPGADGGVTIHVTVQGIVGDPVATGREIGKAIGAYVGAGGRVRVA
ncbi:hypothetical protein [Nocardioides sp. NPDC006273]|uniref:hypothetical protein n=1 Tax=Nocardioides sp. NPDC006273 TaxID=3155598 RepID=UPI0033AE16D1